MPQQRIPALHNPTQADAALATDSLHAPSTTVTIQTRPSRKPEPNMEEEEASKAEGEGHGKRVMSRHGTVLEEEGEEGHGHAAATDPKINGPEEEEETEEDRRYDDVELEETDCPLCHFMRASPCGRTWARWEKCIHFHKEKEEDFVGPCSRVTLRLAQCIEAHKEGFPPMLRNALMGGGKDGADEEEEEGAAAEESEGREDMGAAQVAPAPETSTALAATGAGAAKEAEAKKEA